MCPSHPTPRRPPARWSKRTDALVRYIAARGRPVLQSELGDWIEASPRFRSFVEANQDKIRKKLGSTDAAGHLDVRSELLVAWLLLADRRFELAFEAYGAQRLGPDLTVTYRANLRFNLEVTRLRATPEADPGGAEPSQGVPRLANIVAGKLRQLPAEVPNALVIVTAGLALEEATLGEATRLLKQHNDRRDDVFFARRGFRDARDFYAQYLHLSGIVALDEGATGRRAIFAANREARHPLPGDVPARLIGCLDAAADQT
jgi:hypothetical protein